MEMTGNLINYAVGFLSSSNSAGRNFVGDHGNGNLSTTGSIPGNSSWPLIATSVIKKPMTSINEMASRINISNSPARESSNGGRGVRTQ
jgi:hypothetical protein